MHGNKFYIGLNSNKKKSAPFQFSEQFLRGQQLKMVIVGDSEDFAITFREETPAGDWRIINHYSNGKNVVGDIHRGFSVG